MIVAAPTGMPVLATLWSDAKASPVLPVVGLQVVEPGLPPSCAESTPLAGGTGVAGAGVAGAGVAGAGVGGVGVAGAGVGVTGFGVATGVGVGVAAGVGVTGTGVGVTGTGVDVAGAGVGVTATGVGVTGTGVGVTGTGVGVAVGTGVGVASTWNVGIGQTPFGTVQFTTIPLGRSSCTCCGPEFAGMRISCSFANWTPRSVSVQPV